MSHKTQSKGDADCAAEAGRLSEQHLQASVTDSYKHNILDDDTEQEKEAKRQAAMEAKRKAAQQKFEEEELARQAKEAEGDSDGDLKEESKNSEEEN